MDKFAQRRDARERLAGLGKQVDFTSKCTTDATSRGIRWCELSSVPTRQLGRRWPMTRPTPGGIENFDDRHDQRHERRERQSTNRRSRHRSLLRRLGRRHAARRNPVYQHVVDLRQRRGHAARLSGGDSRAGGLHSRGQRFPDQLLQPRHPHPGRRGGRADRDEPGCPGQQLQRRHRRWDRGGQRGRLQTDQLRQGPPRNRSARGRHARWLSRLSRTDGEADRGSRGRLRPDHQGGQPLQELLRTGHRLLAV
jgi:hypothetical protein